MQNTMNNNANEDYLYFPNIDKDIEKDINKYIPIIKKMYTIPKRHITYFLETDQVVKDFKGINDFRDVYNEYIKELIELGFNEDDFRIEIYGDTEDRYQVSFDIFANDSRAWISAGVSLIANYYRYRTLENGLYYRDDYEKKWYDLFEEFMRRRNYIRLPNDILKIELPIKGESYSSISEDNTYGYEADGPYTVSHLFFGEG